MPNNNSSKETNSNHIEPSAPDYQLQYTTDTSSNNTVYASNINTYPIKSGDSYSSGSVYQPQQTYYTYPNNPSSAYVYPTAATYTATYPNTTPASYPNTTPASYPNTTPASYPNTTPATYTPTYPNTTYTYQTYAQPIVRPIYTYKINDRHCFTKATDNCCYEKPNCHEKIYCHKKNQCHDPFCCTLI